ncbi:MAG: hypothetical protein HY842_03605 [Bacteroidetes bacterium]|nr:hypothetical protein [Bacteroidota bacterium]
MKKRAFIRWASLLSAWAITGAGLGQTTVDEQAFRSLSDAGRYRFVHDFPFDKMDSSGLANLLPRLLDIANEKGDRHTAFAVLYHKCRAREALKLTAAARDSLFEEMETTAAEGGFEIEAVVARHFVILENYQKIRIPPGQSYAEILQELEQLEAIGLEKFRDYSVARLLFQDGSFLYQLEDYERALPCLLAAEQFFDLEEKWEMYWVIQVLNYVYSIYQHQKDYPKGIEHAKKLLDFVRTYQPKDTVEGNLCHDWQGIASIDIASMLVAQKKFDEAEKWANEGYELVKTSEKSGFQAETEFNALTILVPAKIELGKMGDAERLLRRMETIHETFPQTGYFYFKHLGFYESCVKFYEKKGDLAAAMRFVLLAKPLKDSLDRRNDVRKLEQIKQRLDAQKYTEQIRLVEREKEIEHWQKNAALLLLALVLALAFGIFKRLRNRRRQAQAELESAQKELEMFTSDFRKKAELAENLRLETEKLARLGERSEYLERLTHSTILTEDEWQRFRSIFEKLHPQFIAEQKALFPDLTPAEVRLIVLEKLDLSTQEMANILGVSVNTIHQTQSRLRRKTGPSPA